MPISVTEKEYSSFKDSWARKFLSPDEKFFFNKIRKGFRNFLTWSNVTTETAIGISAVWKIVFNVAWQFYSLLSLILVSCQERRKPSSFITCLMFVQYKWIFFLFFLSIVHSSASLWRVQLVGLGFSTVRWWRKFTTSILQQRNYSQQTSNQV